MVTLSFIPYGRHRPLSGEARVDLILQNVHAGSIVVLEGRLPAGDEALLIQRTMERVGKRFTGIELAVVNPEGHGNSFIDLRSRLGMFLLGKRAGFTVVGPAVLLKKITQAPEQLELLLRQGHL